jgi:hypothetical protein
MSVLDDRTYLLWTLPAVAVILPLTALVGLLSGVGPLSMLWSLCTMFVFVSPITGVLGLRTLARVGNAVPPSMRRMATTWCYLALGTPVLLYLGLRALAGS